MESKFHPSMNSGMLSISMWFSIFFLIPIVLSAQTENWQCLFPDIDRPVYDLEYSYLENFAHFGMIFALPGSAGGLGYFSSEDSLQIESIASNLGAVDLWPDDENERILCAFGSGSNGDGLYAFDPGTRQFSLLQYALAPSVITRLSSGYYLGYGGRTPQGQFGGLYHSTTADSWSAIEFFDGLAVTDVAETRDSVLFVATVAALYIQVADSFQVRPVSLPINDIYVRRYPHENEVYIACGEGTYSDCVYEVEYDESGITGLRFVNWFVHPSCLYEYEGFLVVGGRTVLSQDILYLVDANSGDRSPIATLQDFRNIHCITTHNAIDCPNLIVGTDTGFYMQACIPTALDDCQTALPPGTLQLQQNYPNPFNASTTIRFTLAHESRISVRIYDLLGKQIGELLHTALSPGIHRLNWSASDRQGKPLPSAIYICRIVSEKGGTQQIPMLLLR